MIFIDGSNYSFKQIQGMERSLLKSLRDVPVVFTYDYTSQKARTSLLQLNNYFRKQEKNPEMVATIVDFKSIIACNTKDGLVECQYCQKKIAASEISIDHYVPFFFGGKSYFNNLRLACRSCNVMKGSILPSSMSVTWNLFQEKLSANESCSAFNLLKTAQKMNLSSEEAKLVDKLIQVEIKWRTEKNHTYELELEEVAA